MRRLLVALFSLLVLTLITFRFFKRAEDPLPELREAAAKTTRPVDGRLAGFDWSARGQSQDLAVRAVAASVLQNPGQPHAAGVAYLFLDQPAKSVEQLESVVQREPWNGGAWNNLAVARLAQANLEHSEELLPAALSAIDRAVALAPKMPEAKFNRALILKRLGLLRASERSWRDFLAHDAQSRWAVEARQQLDAVVPAAKDEFVSEIRRSLSDGAALDAVAQRWPQESRSWAEGVLPSEWAAAANADDAMQHLSAARVLAESVKRAHGDQMAVDAIAIIDRANPRQRNDLAAAYRAYRDGRFQLSRQNPARAEESLRRATALFERGASPMSQVALYFVAVALGQRDEGLATIAVLRELIPSIDGTRHPALLGQAEWELGLREAFRGNWNSALLLLADANAILSRLGETANAALVQATLAELHDRLGQIELGWQQRTPALEALSRSGADERFAAALAGAIRAEIARGDVASAIALCRVSVEEMRLSANKVLVAETHIRLAQILGYSGGIDGARKALAEAIAATRLIADPALRAQRLAELAVVEADLVRTSDPKRALAMLDSSLRYYAENDLSMLVPAAYLARGRAARAMGDTQAACDSFEKGIDELTRQRQNVGARELRETVFDSGKALFNELIDLRLKRHEAEPAFETIENARARTLLEGLSSSSPHSQSVAFADIAAHRNPGSIVLEYAILPDRLAIFVIADGRLHVVEHPISERQLAEIVTRCVDAIVRRESVASIRRSSSIAYAHLIAPVASFAKPAKTIVIVPDRFLHAIPFAALFDGSRWFIEDHELVIAPSSSALLRPRVVAQTSPNILIVTDPPGSEDVLVGARRESSAIAQTYGNAAMILSGGDATVANFRAMAPRFSIIHYSGHARANAVAAELPLIAESAADRLDGSAIAAMQLPRTSLVVLAACDTIRGATNRIEGMPSLARAFLAAGSEAVIGSLWKIEDRSSARFFSDFHERLHGGSPPAAALAEIQRNFLRSPDASLSHPATWSSLQFIGSE